MSTAPDDRADLDGSGKGGDAVLQAPEGIPAGQRARGLPLRELLSGLSIVSFAAVKASAAASGSGLRWSAAPPGAGEAFASPPIAGIASDSRQVRPGFLFVAIRGSHADGHQYILQAVERGAAAIVAEQDWAGPVNAAPAHMAEGVHLRNGAQAAGRPVPSATPVVPVVLVPDTRQALPVLVANFYGRPAERLFVVAVTGTVGKTSTALMIWHLMRQAGWAAGVIGSLGIRFGSRSMPSPLTTPDALTLQRVLATMAEAGVTHVVMEVSSHALVQHRADQIPFGAAVFTNLLPYEHEDLHPSFAQYIETKRKLLDLLKPTAAVIYNQGDPRVCQLAARWPAAQTLGFRAEGEESVAGKPRPSRGAWAHKVRSSAEGSSFWLYLPDRSRGDLDLPVRIPLLGANAVVNATAAAACVWAMGASAASIREGLSTLPPIRRRMEILHRDGFTVLDDTSGHPASFDRLFETVRRLRPAGTVVVVAVRGRRGAHINSLNGQCLARWARDLPIRCLVVTASADATDPLNVAEEEECQAFLQPLKKGRVRYAYFENLADAIRHGLAQVRARDILVLAGAQGMNEGASILRRLLAATAGGELGGLGAGG